MSTAAAAQAPPGASEATRVVRDENHAPIADAGRGQTVSIGTSVRLDGTRSSDADGDRLSYAWSIVRRPALSQARLSNAHSALPTFVADTAGAYVLRLITLDGADTSRPAFVTIDTHNSAPVADAGPGRTVAVGETVRLSAAGSSDVDGGELSYDWWFQSRPRGSRAAFSAPGQISTAFVADRPGRYVVRVAVSDGRQRSAPAAVVVDTRNTAPVADAGRAQSIAVGTPVQLDGSGSTDADGDLLSHAWSLLSRPQGSRAELVGADAVTPAFVPDQPGLYVAQVIVRDREGASDVASVAFMTGNSRPTARAGHPRTVGAGQLAVLDGSASGDPDGDSLSYRWTLLSRPPRSAASLAGGDTAVPSFIVDQPGLYVAQLIVNDGVADSAPAVTIVQPVAAPPVAVPRVAPTSGAGPLVQLDGSLSFDPDGSPLSYGWALVSRPSGSAAVLVNPGTVDPTFTIDRPGVYVAQLIVDDGIDASAPATVLVDLTVPGLAADAGPDQVADIATTVLLDGGASTGATAFAWSFVSRPSGSAATLSNATTVAPSFVVDVPGDYVVQLTATGAGASGSDTMTVRTAAGALALSPAGLSLAVGGSGALVVTRAGLPAGVGPVISLTSSDPAVAAVPAEIAIPFGQASAVIPVTGGTSGAAIITASVAGQSVRAIVAVGGRLVEWVSDVSGSWQTPSNWSINAVPIAGDVVLIDRPAANVVVTVPTATAVVRALYSTEHVVVTGTLGLAGDAVLARGLTLTGGLSGPGNVVLGGVSTWNSGTVALTGGLMVEPGQTLTLATAATHVLSAGPLTNHGRVVLANGGFWIQGVIDVLNATDGVWEVQGDHTLTSTLCGTPTFTNAGVLRKTAGTGQFQVGACVAMTNTGTVDVQVGSIRFTSPATLVTSGQLTAAAGATFYLDRVTLQTGTTFSGSGTLDMGGITTVNGALSVTVPSVLGGTVTGSGQLTLAAPMTWNGGTVALAGGLVVGSGQTLTVATAATHVLSTGSLTNHGTVGWANGGFWIQGVIDVLNASDGVWDVQGDHVLTSTVCGTPTFTNAGVLRKTAGAGQFQVGACVAMTNTGTLDVQVGSVRFAPSAVLLTSGQLTVAAGTTLYLDRVTLQTGTTFSGSGTLDMSGTTVTGAISVPLPSVLAGTVTGSGQLTLAAPMTWNSGTVALAGGLVVGSGQTLTLATPATHVLTTGSLTNHGTVVWATGDLWIQGAINVSNAVDGVWDVQGNHNLTSTVCGAPTFTNAGVLRKTAGTGQFQVGACVVMTNTGTLDVQVGSVRFAPSAVLLTSGQLTVVAGATLYLDRVTLQTGTTFGGSGTLDMSGTTTVAGVVAVTLPSLLAGTVTGSGQLTLAAPMTWNSGTVALAGGLVVGSGQTLTMATPATHVLTTGSLTNHGTVVWTGGDLFVQGTIDVLNASDGVWEAQGNHAVTSTVCGAPTFTNAGVVRMAGVTSTLSFFSCVSLSNTSSGVIRLRLGGTAIGQFDRVVSSPSVVRLDGALDVTLTNGFTPLSGHTFALVTYGSRIGAFAAINGNGEIYTSAYTATALTLQKP